MEHNPYEKVSEIVRAWCEENYYDTMLVTLKLDNEVETVLLDFGSEGRPIAFWDTDWWEGQETVELLGFLPLELLEIHGIPKLPEGNHGTIVIGPKMKEGGT